MSVTRIARFGEYVIESDMSADDAIIQIARDIMAGNARDGAPFVSVSENGRVTLRYPLDAGTVTYITNVDTSIPIMEV